MKIEVKMVEIEGEIDRKLLMEVSQAIIHVYIWNDNALTHK